MGAFDADVIVVGLGAVGSAALHAVAARGASVIGFEQFGRGHERGSHHGHTRVFRHAYFEHPDYVPLLLESTAAIRDLERVSNSDLMNACGVLVWGPRDSAVVHQSADSADRFGVPVERLDCGSLRRRFPWFSVPNDSVGLYEPGGGFVRSLATIRAHLARAEQLGADVRTSVGLESWQSGSGGVRIQTTDGPVRARSVLFALGAWTGHWVPSVAPLLTVTRQVQGWVNCPSATPSVLPCWLVDRPGQRPLYGIPVDGAGGGAKIAVHGSQDVVCPRQARTPVSACEIQALATARDETIPGLLGEVSEASSCLYTVTPDEHFLLGAVPGHLNAWLAAGLSGHGFKLAAALGAALADFALMGKTDRPVGFLCPSRFAG